jgi:WD40 repeat protein
MTRGIPAMMFTRRSTVVLTMAWVLASLCWADPALSQPAGLAASAAAADGPGRGALAGFVVTPQTKAAGNRTLLLAPNGKWFLATSPRAAGARLIDMRTGLTFRFLTRPGLHIAGLSISSDSKTVFAQDYDGKIVAWDAETGQPAATPPQTDLHDITRLSLTYEGNDVGSRATPEQLERYHLLSHFPELKKFDAITINPTQNYAIIGHVGDPGWKAFQIWNLKTEKTEVFFRLDDSLCGGLPFAFDFDGKHLVFGNSGGGCDSNHLDFTTFRIDYFGPDVGPKTAQASQILGYKCSDPPGMVGFDQQFAISPDARFITRVGVMPGGPEAVAWDLHNGEKTAAIRPDGYQVNSPDSRTSAVLHDLQRDGARSTQRMTVIRDGRQTTFEIPPSMQADHWRPVVLSSNGRWIASQEEGTVAVWSSSDGKALREYQIGKGRISEILRVSDLGDPLLVNDNDGTALVNGSWRPARSDDNGLIVPLTPNFQAQCGVIFCDRVVAELGVVERKPVDSRARDAARKHLSPDGRFMIANLDYTDRSISRGTDIVDIASGKVVLHIDQEDQPRFASDGRSIVVSDFSFGSFNKYDLATGRRVWTAIPNRNQDGFYMIMADGRVRYSARRYPDFALVREFETRPFDAEAAKQFVVPPDR